VLLQPFANESQRAGRQRAAHHRPGGDLDLGFFASVDRVEVRGGWSLKYISITIPKKLLMRGMAASLSFRVVSLLGSDVVGRLLRVSHAYIGVLQVLFVPA
jgi:hypothetical protein